MVSRAIVRAFGAAMMLAAVSCSGPHRDRSIIRSPQGTYQGELVGDFGRARALFVTHAAVLRLRTADGGALKEILVHDGDFMDDGFRERFPREAWLNERALRFESIRSSRSQEDEVVLENRGQAALPWLRIDSSDVLIVLDLAPGEIRRLAVGGQRRVGSIYVGALATRADGSVLKAAGDFSPALQAQPEAPNQVIVTITDAEIGIRVVLPGGIEADR